MGLLITSMFPSFGQEQSGYDIRLKVKGFQDSVAYLGYHFGDKKYLQDTSLVSSEGDIRFQGGERLKRGVYFLYTPNYYMEFLVNEQRFYIETEAADHYVQMNVSGSRENEIFRDFQLIMIGHQKKIKAITEKLGLFSTKEDTARAYEQIELLKAENESLRDSLEKANPSTYIGSLLRLIKTPAELTFDTDSLTRDQKKEKYLYYKDHFFDGINFTDEGSMRAPVFHSKIIEYLDKVTFQVPDSVIASVDYILNKMEGNPETFRYWVVTLFQRYQNPSIMGMDRLFLHIADNYYLNRRASWVDDAMIKELTDELKFHRENQLGNKAPQIHLLDSGLAPLNLYALKKSYTVLYFYDPDCGHCKKKTPELAEAYRGMKDDVDILAVNVATDMDRWKNFIVKHNLNWLNAADPYYRSNFRVQYNVRSTPMIYILDKDKNIIAKKLGVDDIDGFINDHRAFMKGG